MNENPFNRCPVGPLKWICLCREDKSPSGDPGKYVLATSDAFEDRESAIRYRDSICPSRQPIIARLAVSPKT